MTRFRMVLLILLVAVVIYTIPVVMAFGLTPLLPNFFSEMYAMTWQGQFNTDFMGFLVLSALWTAWRNGFSGPGLGLGLIAFFAGIPFLTTYLLILSYQEDGDIQRILLGVNKR
jgi:hypothetical protein